MCLSHSNECDISINLLFIEGNIMSVIQLLEKLGANATFSTNDITAQDKAQLSKLVNEQNEFVGVQVNACSEPE